MRSKPSFSWQLRIGVALVIGLNLGVEEEDVKLISSASVCQYGANS